MTTEPATLTAALEYLDRGFSVIPTRGHGSTENRKKPALEAWKEYQEAAPDEATVRGWYAADPSAGVAVVTGSVSRLVVVDLDGPRAATLLREHASLPRTATARTGKGFHAYYRHAGADIRSRTEVAKDGEGSQVDVRAEGGYVAAPPSVHGSGRVYAWAVPLDELTDLPPDLEEFLLSGQPGQGAEGQPEEWWSAVAGGVAKGGRNQAATRVAGYFARATHGDAAATARAAELWNTQNDPPLPATELATVVKSVISREEKRRLAEAVKGHCRIEVVDGPTLAAELENTEPRKGIAVGVPGLPMVDGLVEGDLLVLAGRPGMGKSSYAAQVTAESCLKLHVPTLVISTEMNRREWGMWTAAAAFQVPVWQIPRPWPPEMLDAFRRAPIAIVDAGAPTIADIRAIAENNLGRRLLIVDHIGKISAGRRETRTLELGDVVRGLKALARDLRCTVLALCQLNRDIENRENKRPRLVDLRESGEIEQESDAVLFLYGSAGYDPKATIRSLTLALEKFRHGPLRDQAVTFHTVEHRFELRHGQPGGVT